MWKTLSASAQPYIWPVDVTQYLNNRKHTKPGNVICLLTKSVCYQWGKGLKIPITSLNFVINHCTTLQIIIDIVLVSSWIYFVLESDFMELNWDVLSFASRCISQISGCYDNGVPRYNAYNLINYFGVCIHLSLASSEMLEPCHIRAWRINLEDRNQNFFFIFVKPIPLTAALFATNPVVFLKLLQWYLG